MKRLFGLILLLLLLTSCYVYKPLEPTVDEEGNEVPVPPIKEQLEKDRLYKVEVAIDSVRTKTYKIQFDQFEGDSIVGKINANETKVVKLDSNKVQLLKHRNFQPWYSNGLTILAYAGIIVGVILLL